MTHDKENNKKYSCQKCTQTFLTKDQLLTHSLRRHTDLKPFKCDHCGKRFNAKSNRNSHVKEACRKLFPKKANKHACRKCQKQFLRKFNCVKHEKRCKVKELKLENITNGDLIRFFKKTKALHKMLSDKVSNPSDEQMVNFYKMRNYHNVNQIPNG